MPQSKEVGRKPLRRANTSLSFSWCRKSLFFRRC